MLGHHRWWMKLHERVSLTHCVKFYRPVEGLEYTDLLRRTFIHPDHERGFKCEHCWSIEGYIHSKRRNKLHQTLVEKLVLTHTNLVLRESLDDVLPEIIIDDPVDESEEEPEV